MVSSLAHSNGNAYLIFTSPPDMMYFMLYADQWFSNEEQKLSNKLSRHNDRCYKYNDVKIDLRSVSELMIQKKLEFPCCFILEPESEQWEHLTTRLAKMYIEGNKITLEEKLRDIDEILKVFNKASDENNVDDNVDNGVTTP